MELDIENEIAMGMGPENEETCEKWARPNPPNIHPNVDSLVFQQIDIDNYIGPAMPGMPGPQVCYFFSSI